MTLYAGYAKLAGDFSYRNEYGSEELIFGDNLSSTVTLLAPEGGFKTDTRYYISILPNQEMPRGYSLTFRKRDGSVFVYRSQSESYGWYTPGQILNIGDVQLGTFSSEECITNFALIEAVEDKIGAWSLDLNADGTLPLTEANRQALAKVTDLYIPGQGFSSLDGIEHLVNLEELSCFQNCLSELDLSALPRLKQLDCQGNFLTELDLSRCPDLTDVNCGGNRIRALDFSDLHSLLFLDCSGNILPELDLTNNPGLIYLNCDNTGIERLHLPDAMPYLQTLRCSDNRLTSLSLDTYADLENLDCHGNALAELSLLGNPSIRDVVCGNQTGGTLQLYVRPDFVTYWQFGLSNHEYNKDVKLNYDADGSSFDNYEEEDYASDN